MKRRLSIVIAALVLLTSQNALGLEEQRRTEVREEIRRVRIWEMTRYLELDDLQAQLLFPIEDEHEAQMEAIRRERAGIEAEMEDRLDERRKDDRQLLVYLERLKQVDKKLDAYEGEFERKLSRILRPEQIVRYRLFERRFEARLKEIIRDIQRDARMDRRDEGNRRFGDH